MIFKTPTVLMPTVVSGRVKGPIRVESLDGLEMYLPERSGTFDIAPFEMYGKRWAVSHLQKLSTAGYLIMSPFIIHKWNFWKLQERKTDRNGFEIWQPGTERGIYARTPGWRWDVAGTEGKHWIFSKGYIGGHWD